MTLIGGHEEYCRGDGTLLAESFPALLREIEAGLTPDDGSFATVAQAADAIRFAGGRAADRVEAAGGVKALFGRLTPGVLADVLSSLTTLADVARLVAEQHGLVAPHVAEGLDPTRVRVSLDDDGDHEWDFASRDGGEEFLAEYGDGPGWWVTSADVVDTIDAIADHAYADEHPAETVARLAKAAGSAGIVHPGPDDEVDDSGPVDPSAAPTSESDGLGELLDGLGAEVAGPGCCPEPSGCPVRPVAPARGEPEARPSFLRLIGRAFRREGA